MINLPNKVEKYPIYPLKLKKKREKTDKHFLTDCYHNPTQPLHKYIYVYFTTMKIVENFRESGLVKIHTNKWH